MKVIVTGGSGLLGRALLRLLSTVPSVQVLGTAFSRARESGSGLPRLERLDLRDPVATRAFLDASNPDWIIHCAAERRPDMVDRDPEGARLLNVGAVATLADWVAQHPDSRLLYLSTDYVFDGTNPPYHPDSPTNPLNAYGTMKLQGELAVRSAGASWTILRIPILYGAVESLSESPITEIATKLVNNPRSPVEHWATRYPAHAEDVARAIGAIIAANGEESAGRIFHFAGGEALTKYEMARIIAPLIGAKTEDPVPDPQPPAGAPRPKDCRLDGAALAALGFSPRIPFSEGVESALQPFFPLRP